MIDPLATIDGVNPHLVEVGEHSVVGAHAALLTHCPIRGARRVVISDYVWIGYGALILPGVTIGPYCVIGAGSVVTNDIPANSIAAGNPARVLRELTKDERDYLHDHLTNHKPMGKDDE